MEDGTSFLCSLMVSAGLVQHYTIHCTSFKASAFFLLSGPGLWVESIIQMHERQYRVFASFSCENVAQF